MRQLSFLLSIILLAASVGCSYTCTATCADGTTRVQIDCDKDDATEDAEDQCPCGNYKEGLTTCRAELDLACFFSSRQAALVPLPESAEFLTQPRSSSRRSRKLVPIPETSPLPAETKYCIEFDVSNSRSGAIKLFVNNVEQTPAVDPSSSDEFIVEVTDRANIAVRVTDAAGNTLPNGTKTVSVTDESAQQVDISALPSNTFINVNPND